MYTYFEFSTLMKETGCDAALVSKLWKFYRKGSFDLVWKPKFGKIRKPSGVSLIKTVEMDYIPTDVFFTDDRPAFNDGSCQMVLNLPQDRFGQLPMHKYHLTKDFPITVSDILNYISGFYSHKMTKTELKEYLTNFDDGDFNYSKDIAKNNLESGMTPQFVELMSSLIFFEGFSINGKSLNGFKT